MGEPRLVFDLLVDGLYNKAYREKLSPGAREEMRKVGIDLDRRLLPAYPLEVWERCLEIAATDLFGKVELSNFVTMGERYVGVFRDTLVGAADVIATPCSHG